MSKSEQSNATATANATAKKALADAHYGVPPQPEMLALEVVTDPVVMPTKSWRKFATKWGVHPAFLPFDERAISPLETLAAIRRIIERKPITASRIRVSEIVAEMNVENESGVTLQDLDTLFYSIGGWRISREKMTSNQRVRRWVNPRYMNDSGKETHGLGQYADLRADGTGLHMSDELIARRIEWICLGSSLGLDGYHLARRMDVSSSSFFEFATRHGIAVSEYQRSGNELLARTWKTAYDWGTPYYTIAAATGLAESTIRVRISRLASEFEPPTDPTTVNANGSIY